MCHQMPFWCGIRCKTFLANYGCGCVWAVPDLRASRFWTGDKNTVYQKHGLCHPDSSSAEQKLETQNPPKIPKYQKNTAFTRTFSKSPRELLSSFLYHESGTQWNCSDELVQMNFFILGGFFRVDFPLLKKGTGTQESLHRAMTTAKKSATTRAQTRRLQLCEAT